MALLDPDRPRHYNKGPIKSIHIKGGLEGATINKGTSMTVTGLSSLSNSNGETWVFAYYDLSTASASTHTFTTNSSITKESGNTTTIGTSNISSDADAAIAVRTALYAWWATSNSHILLYTISEISENTFTISDPGPPLGPSGVSILGAAGNITSDPEGGTIAAQSGSLITGGKITTTEFTGGISAGRATKYSVIVNETDSLGRFNFETAKAVHRSTFERRRLLLLREASSNLIYTPPTNQLVPASESESQSNVLRSSRYNFLDPVPTDTETLALASTAGTKLIPVEVMDSTTATSLKAWYKAELYEGNTALATSLGTSVNIQDHSGNNNTLTQVNNPPVIGYKNNSDLSFVFNGTNQYFTNTTSTAFDVGQNGFAMFVVFTTPNSFTDDAYRTIFDKSDDGKFWYLRYKVDDDSVPTNGVIDFKMGGTLSANVQKTLTLATNTTYLLTVARDGSNNEVGLYVNGDGKVTATNNFDTSSTNTPIELGVSKTVDRFGNITRLNYFDGLIQEFIFYDLGSSNDIADNPRERVEGYLAHKWGLSGNLPSDHPFKEGTPAPISFTTSVGYTGTTAS